MIRRRIRLWALAAGGAFLIAFAGTFLYSRAWDRGLILEPMYTLPTSERIVALTFDDGPSPVRTPAVLQLLDSCNVKATFFMLGRNIEKYPQIAAAVHHEGHLIGNHSYSHQRLIFRSPGFIREEVNRTDKLIARLGQSEVRFFRPPYCSKYLILPIVLRQESKQLVTGTYGPPAQYSAPFNPRLVADQVVSNARPGSIIFLHDGNDSSPGEFIESVRLIIDGLTAQHYAFVTLDHQNN